MSALQVGDRPLLTYVAKAGGTPTDATVTLIVTRPDGTTVSPAIAHPALGTYTASVDLDQAGFWTYRWAASGPVVDAEDGSWRVRRATDLAIYATEDELRAQFRDVDGALEDSLLHRALRASSRAVDTYCGRRFWRDNTAVTRRYKVEQPGLVWVDDFWTTSGLVVEVDESGTGASWTTWTLDVDYQVEPLNADADAAMGDGAYAWWMLTAVGDRPFPEHPTRATVRATTKWGWSALPDDVPEATLLKAASLFKRRDAPFGIANFGDFGPVRISLREDPDVARLLRGVVKSRGESRTLQLDPQVGSLFHGGRR